MRYEIPDWFDELIDSSKGEVSDYIAPLPNATSRSLSCEICRERAHHRHIASWWPICDDCHDDIVEAVEEHETAWEEARIAQAEREGRFYDWES